MARKVGQEAVPSAGRLRRERERSLMRAKLLATARTIAAEEGWQAVTIRRIADRLEYTSPVIYQHFASKDALLLELVQQGFEEIGQPLAAAVEGAPGTLVPAIGQAMWDYAFAAPELYQLMHGLGGLEFGTVRAPATARRLFALVRDALIRDAAALGGQLPDPDGAAETVWAFVHGFVSLTMSERVAGGAERANRLLTENLPILFRGMLR